MNSANRTTLTMLLLAVVSVIAAMIYFPWPEFAEVDEEVGQPLFEQYELRSIRGIDIIQFDSDKGTLDRIKLSRRGEKWIIPARQNFIASASQRIGFAIDCLNDKTVYEVISENQQDHIKYGVVDPTEYTVEQNVAALGQKLTLTDRNNQTIADLIVGKTRKDDPTKRYVRVPGKPRVYVIDFNANVLSTRFMDWVSPNVLGLQGQQAGQGRQIVQFIIDNYRIPQEQGSPAKRNTIYRSAIVPNRGQLNVRLLQVPQGDDWKTLSLTPEQQAKLTNAVQYLIRFAVDDARRTPEQVAAALKSPGEEITESTFSELARYGIFKKESDDDGLDFQSINGEIEVTTTDGVKTTISIGEVGSQNSAGSGQLNYFVLISSAIDSKFLPEPVRPNGLENDESDENKEFLKKVKQWETAVERAKQRANEMNSINADWFYLVGEDIIKNLRPEIPLPIVARPKKVENVSAQEPGENSTKPEAIKSDSSENAGSQNDAEPDNSAATDADK